MKNKGAEEIHDKQEYIKRKFQRVASSEYEKYWDNLLWKFVSFSSQLLSLVMVESRDLQFP